ncbi:flagellar basal-body MS-ring/collar protein FliF [Henriciella aquimarina]|uniref:flagellar basal-body MS-ring/collar protein FliF n=1 Tax=Henriciella aquimarina TaxID=545261 RepID=UPI000A020131|nr:flagellar basal-body MS-ring/collar protein FliF [Henriciella aquimarina]
MKFIETLKGLSLTRQLALAGAVLGVVLAMTMLVRGTVKEPMALLYSGLEPVNAGEVIEELDKRGINYEIKGESIFIPRGDRDEVRFALAKDGLPQQSVKGYELLDDVNGFSVTSEMYNAKYWQAKEGELTRTILAIPGVQSARVHIGASLQSGFTRSGPPQTASVSVSAAHDLTPQQAQAIQYMVALAVSGLAAEDVAVIDPAKGMIAGPDVEKAQQPTVVAEDKAGQIESKIMRLLEARVGPGNARVSVSVDVTRQRQRVSEVTYDPESRVVRNRSINDSSETSNGSNASVSVASNLPAGEGQGGGSSSTIRNSSESVSYEVNERRTETEMLPGEIEKVSVAVLLNQGALDIDPASANAGTISQGIINDFEALILSGAGLDTERGDKLTVELMPFQEVPAPEMVEAPGMVETLIERHLWSAVQAGLLGLVVVALGFGVIRPLLTQKAGATSTELVPTQSIDGEIVSGDEGTDPFDFLKDYTRERQDETAALLQSWLDEDRKVAVNE